MGLRVRVCRVEDVPPGATRGFAVPGVAVPVLVANVDGHILAASSMCPHEDVSLLGGKRKKLQVICPGHGYRFNLRTGACSHDDKLRLPCYRVTIIDGDVFADLL